MKKLALFIAGLLLLVVVSGCSNAVQAFTEPGKAINTGLNQEFTIALGSNPTTGYSWQPSYDENNLNLINQTYREQDTTGEQLVGAAGTEYFIFRALNGGETRISFTYRRPWEKPSLQDQTVVFTVNTD